MRLFFFIIICFLFRFVANSQSNQEPAALFFANSATRSLYSHNPDSTVYFIRRLADSSTYGRDLFTEFIHNQFAQVFGYQNFNAKSKEDVKRLNNYTALIKKMLYQLQKDTSQKIQTAVRPIYFAVQVKDSIHSNKAVRRLVTDFINGELLGDIYLNRQARYGLYIYNLISGNKELKPLADSLLESLKDKLMADQPAIASNRLQLEKRAWYRFLYSYTCNREADETVDAAKKKLLLQEAFQYSPDAIDMSNKGQFFYDMIFLFDDEKYNFRERYLHFLQNHGGSKDEILAALSTMAVLDMGYKQKLKTFYAQNYAKKQPFDEYWLQLSAKEAKEKAPLIHLTLLNNKTFSSEDEKGKWVLVDFWGTWCRPCRMEHPDLEKFYKSVILPNPDKICLLTIACRDRNELVADYMKEKGFSFPVAMADSSVATLYNVQNYPTKVLITPEGNYMVIPFGFDWTNYVKEIVDL